MKFNKLLIAVCGIVFFGCGQKVSNKEKQPNILFCIADDATWKHMSAYGSKWVNTPTFDRVANQGILFNNAYTPNAKCAPSRATILTGRNSWQLEEAGNHLPFFPVKFKTYAEALSEKGFAVGYTGKGWAPGIAKTAEGENRDLLVNGYNDKKIDRLTTGISPVDYVANFNQFLTERDSNEPFCFWYGGYEPHRAYEYGSGIRLGNKKLSQIEEVFSYWPNVDSVKTDMLDYAFELEYFDTQLGKMLEILEAQGELDNTIVVVTSDNGMPFPRIKGQNYEHSNHLPLAIMWPNGINEPGRVVDDYISFIDFAATFIDVAGYKAEELGMQPIEGQSLRDIFESSKDEVKGEDRDYVLLGKERHDIGRPDNQGYPIRGIRKDNFLYLKNYKTDRWPAGNPETGYTNTDGSPTKSYILNMRRNSVEALSWHLNVETKNNVDTLSWHLNFGKRPEEELFNVAKDEDCMVNLANNPEYAEVKEDLKQLMEAELKKQGDPRMFGNGDVFDNYTPSAGSMFYEKYFAGEKVNYGWINDSDFESEPLD